MAHRISGVTKGILTELRSEISLEDFLKDKINAIPSYLQEFKVETKIVVDGNDRLVVFIEVLNKNWERIFYSNITQYAYIRVGKSAQRMFLPDTLKFISERSYPQVNVEFKSTSEVERRNGKTYIPFGVEFINKGVKAADKVHSFVLVGADEEIDAYQRNGYSTSLETLDLTKFGLNDFKSHNSVREIFQYIYPESTMRVDRIYPFKKGKNGVLAINVNNIDIINKIVVLSLEDNGFVKQEFEVDLGDRVSLREIKSEFSPYLTI